MHAEKRTTILMTKDAKGSIDNIHAMPTCEIGRCYSVNISMAEQFVSMGVAAISVDPPWGTWVAKILENPALNEWVLVVPKEA